MNLETRNAAIEQLRDLGAVEVDRRHVAILAYLIAMRLDINSIPYERWGIESGNEALTLLPNETMVVENVAHLLFEVTTLTPQDVVTMKEDVKAFFRWRLAVASGAIGARIAIYGELVGTTDIIVRLDNYADAELVNQIRRLIARDEDLVNAFITLIDSEIAIVNSEGVDYD